MGAMPKQTIAVDVDDVLAAEREYIIAYSNKHWGYELTLDDYRENWEKMWDVDFQTVRRRADELHAPGMIASYRLMEGSRQALQALSQDYRLVILTSRRQITKDETLIWLNEVFADVFSEVHFTGFWDSDKPGGHLLTKGQLAKQIGAHYLIDDQAKHCFAAAEAGIVSILFGDYAESRGLELPLRVVRCQDWNGVLRYFDAQRR